MALNVVNGEDLFARGTRLQQGGDLAGAEKCYAQVLRTNPAHWPTLNNLGLLAQRQGRIDVATACFQRALAANPRAINVQLNLGEIHRTAGQINQALACCDKALQVDPQSLAALHARGLALFQAHRFAEAVAAWETVIRIAGEKHGQRTSEAQGNVMAASASISEFLGQAYTHIGNSQLMLGHPDAAESAYRKALEFHPKSADLHNDLANCLKDQGSVRDAVAEFRRAAELRPDSAAQHSSVLYTLQFDSSQTAQSLHEEQIRWNQRFAEPLRSSIRPHANDRNPDRRLRIGYVSPDFYDQAEAFFVTPLLESHDHEHFEVHCYASVRRPDAITGRQRNAADAWHDVLALSDEALAAKIRADQIDILIDLTMHMRHNRMMTFARKPAPVQVTWLAYPGSTGLETMDYRLTDAQMDPADDDAPFYAEQSIRLPDCWCCYDPLCDAPPHPPSSPRPTGSDPIRFGSLNNPVKLSDEVLDLWASLLRTVPKSRLLLLVFAEPQRERIRRRFAAHDVDARRLEFVAGLPRPDYLRLYHQIDIALDPLPYNGITTTCDALWMGVPVVTLASRLAAGRAGKSILTAAGVPELAADTPEAFVKIASDLADDPPRLTALHAILRERTVRSALMDAPRFARNVESAYRAMWQIWCAGKTEPAA